MKENELERVFGELYEVSESNLPAINRLEGYVEGGAENLYNRTAVTVYTDKGEEHTGIIYTAGDTLGNSSDRIPSGDWLVYNYLKEKLLLYFSYGSCMDDERFVKAGVEQYFKDVKGKGILHGFAFQFSRSSADGGKADIVENTHEFVEGKVYEVPLDAGTYLYKREGVYSGRYRPAIVPVTINGSTYQALTFIGMEKSPETAPTKLYATEILRGGKDCLSNKYLQKIQQRINRF